ncbi:hypothetical protein VPH1254_0050 [Vibrio phage 1254]|nr:hypothetical protein SIPHO019v1_170001 [Vibrio phage 82E32.1]QZI92551.1 hypothetical protein SIPHO017v1_p0018 [Vibrio phage 19E33.1]QZI92838.1 hypothetical protein SIPHO016v1_p0059 [Vibrio phage 38E33.6a]QZI92964.1 hypothetical protein SIPHO015v1_p0026 [Vibrio phage 82E32.2]QZI93017.1 hypothetical protein SIPHO014v1_p0018 [Vibrio phage 82E32.3]QZI93064.1 hypothetical protein SIPHO013v1_p0003 [Vibrio phage 82E33.2]
MKNYLNDMPVLEKSKLSSFGRVALVLGFGLIAIFFILDGHPIYKDAGVLMVSVGFPSLLAGLVCDCLTRIHNANAHYFNNKD